MSAGLTTAPVQRRRWPALAVLGAFLAGLVATMAALATVLAIAFHLAPAVLSHPDQVPPLASGLYVVGLTASLLAWVAVCWRGLVGRPLSDLVGDRRHAWRELGLGLTVGLGGVGLLATVEVASGLLGFSTPSGPVLPLVTAIPVALVYGLSEEVVFRGFIQRTLLLDLPAPLAVGAGAAFYAVTHFLHAVDPARDALPFLALLGAGLVLGDLVRRQDRVWIAAGLHASWVYAVTVGGQLHLWTHATYPYTGGGDPLGGLLGLVLLVPLWATLRRR